MFGRVLENTLDLMKFQFLERCVMAIKKRGVRAEPSWGFSIYVGKGLGRELMLDEYWTLYTETQDEKVFAQVASAARRLAGG